MSVQVPRQHLLEHARFSGLLGGTSSRLGTFAGKRSFVHYWAEPVPFIELFCVKPVKKSPCNITLVALDDLNCVMCISIQNNCNMLQTNLTQLQLLTHKCIQLIQIAFSCCRLSLPISPFSVLYCLFQYHLLYRKFDAF